MPRRRLGFLASIEGRTRVGRAMVSRVALLLGVAAASSCAPFDTTPVQSERGTLGEEIYKVVCERMATEVWPEDVTGYQSRELCRGDAPPSTAPAGSRLEALAENRDRLVAALDATLPEDLEDELEQLLLDILPFYDPPSELLPSNTRAVAALLTQLMEQDEVMDALGRVSARRGLRPQPLAVGITRPLLAYDGLSELASTTFGLVANDGPIESEWTALLAASALEMTTCEPSPADDPTLSLTRDFLLRQHETFGPEETIYVVARDARGLPIPATLDGSEGFVDTDMDGLADVDGLGRFVDADGDVLDVPTPFAVIGESGVSRDEFGRALSSTDTPLYVYTNIERTVLAGLLRELPKLVDPEDRVLVNFFHGLPPMFGPDASRTETYGELEHAFEGFDTAEGGLFDVVYAVSELLRYDETRDLLTVLRVLLEDHEEVLVPLIEAGLWGDALGDEHPEIDLAEGSELWDDVIQVAQWMAETPGMLEAMLRALNTPAARRIGPIFAEMMRFKDPQVLGPDENVRLDYVYWDLPVDRSMPDVPGNYSLFQQTSSGIHELDRTPLCNKEGARMILDGDTLEEGGWGFLIGILDLIDNTPENGYDITAAAEAIGGLGGALGPWGECELLEIENAAQAFARAVIGRQELTIKAPVLAGITGFLTTIGLGSLNDTLFETASGIDGFGMNPTPHALARLMFGTPNHFVNGLIDPPTTRYGDDFRMRYPGKMVLAWERVFRFCGDRILDEGENTCPTGPIEEVDLYEALAPMLTVFDDYDPLVDDDGNPDTPPRFLFGELVSAFHRHYATPANPMYQYTDPNGPRYVSPDGAVEYEPIAAGLMGGCSWDDEASSDRTCIVEDSGRLISRLSRVMTVLDGLTVRPGVDGIDVAAAALEKVLNPDNNPGLVNRAGEDTTQTNSGTRTLAMTPLHLLLDGLNKMDEGHAADADRSEAWYAARSRLVDIFLERDALPGDEYLFRNRRLHALMILLVDFTAELIDSHASAGDLDEWAHTLDADFQDSVAGAMGSSTVRFLDALDAHPDAQTEILELLAYFGNEDSPNDAFANLLFTSADALYLLEDDDAVITLLNAFSNAFAVDASASAAGAGTLSAEGSAVDEAVNLLASVSQVDVAQTFEAVLRNAVTHPTGDPETPIEVIGDVIAEINRAAPNAGGPMAPNDYGAVMGQVEDMLSDPDRGLERVYGVVQNREL